MKSLLKRYGLFFFILMIGALLLGNIYLIDHNNKIIEDNKRLQENAENIKMSMTEIIRVIHFLDMSVRGYALTQSIDYLRDINNIMIERNQNNMLLEKMLLSENYPMDKFYGMKDSVDAYVRIIAQMRDDIAAGKKELFLKALEQDKGFRAWVAYDRFFKDVNAFENNIAHEAHIRYSNALQNSYMLQIFLFFIIVPTLMYTAFYTSQNMALTEQLRVSEALQNQLLENQNQVLEQKVVERTEEIQRKNEEIVNRNIQLTLQQELIEGQNQTVVSQNQQLQAATRIIEEQSALISARNEELTKAVDRQTSDLLQTNLELVEHNNRLEQFAFIISHNLRAPITRLVGLSNVLGFSSDETDQRNIVSMIVKSTKDLDEVIADLNEILGIQKLSMQVYSDVALDKLMDKIKSILAKEIEETQCELITNFNDVLSINTLPQYAESIFYNLINNALKYRHPDRRPSIKINCLKDGSRLKFEFSDNGLGIDVEKNRANLFSLYKRFHFHVEGKGLGLYLVKTQVTALGGTIDVTSTPFEGSVFTIELAS